jgi:divalent metal cation (Fe/Co/Zn/Cd) transporter
VFAEDAAALVGVLIALAGIGLHQLTGNAAYDAIGSILVGVLLAVVAVILIDRNRRFPAGMAPTEQTQRATRAELERLNEVEKVRFMRLVYVGPRQLFVVAGVDLKGDAVESSVARTLRNLERKLESGPFIVEAVLTVSEPDDQGITAP